MNKALFRRVVSALLARLPHGVSMRLKKAAEIIIFNRTARVDDLPPIFHYWSNKYLRPQFEALGFASPKAFMFQKVMSHAKQVSNEGRAMRMVSFASGRAELEIEMAAVLSDAGIPFEVVCVDINKSMAADAKRNIKDKKYASAFSFLVQDVVDIDFGAGTFDVVILNQCLHHFAALEKVFALIKNITKTDGIILTNDVIGRNGHQLWPEVHEHIDTYWSGIPKRLTKDKALGGFRQKYIDLDHSGIGFEGIRAQDVLPLLCQNFYFDSFIVYGALVIPIVDRRFGWNYDCDNEHDLKLIDELAMLEQVLLESGQVKPTQILACMTLEPSSEYTSNVTKKPESYVRWPE